MRDVPEVAGDPVQDGYGGMGNDSGEMPQQGRLRAKGRALSDACLGGEQRTLRGHASRVPGGSWREAVPPQTPQRQRRVMSAGRAVWVKIRSSEAERAAWHAKARSAGLALSDLVRWPARRRRRGCRGRRAPGFEQVSDHTSRDVDLGQSIANVLAGFTRNPILPVGSQGSRHLYIQQYGGTFAARDRTAAKAVFDDRVSSSRLRVIMRYGDETPITPSTVIGVSSSRSEVAGEVVQKRRKDLRHEERYHPLSPLRTGSRNGCSQPGSFFR